MLHPLSHLRKNPHSTMANNETVVPSNAGNSKRKFFPLSVNNLSSGEQQLLLSYIVVLMDISERWIRRILRNEAVFKDAFEYGVRKGKAVMAFCDPRHPKLCCVQDQGICRDDESCDPVGRSGGFYGGLDCFHVPCPSRGSRKIFVLYDDKAFDRG